MTDKPQPSEDAIDAILTTFIMQYDQKIKIGNKRNVEATERAKAAIKALYRTEQKKLLAELLEAMPEKRNEIGSTENPSWVEVKQAGAVVGFNEAMNQARAIIEQKIKSLEGEK